MPQNMYLFVKDGSDNVNILHLLAWSHGLSQRDEIQSQKQPAIAWNKWTNEEVIKWLCDSNLESLVEIFKSEDITGKEIAFLGSEELKPHNVKLGPRTRFDIARSELVRKNPIPEEETSYRGSYSQDISVTCYFDDRACKFLHYLFSTITIPEANLVCYKGSGRGYGNDNDNDDLPKAQVGEPMMNISLKNCKVTSISTGGSGGEDRFTANITLSYEEIVFDIQQFPSNEAKSYANYHPTPHGVEVHYFSNEKKSTYREWGKVTEWNSKTHFSFPKEFREIVKFMMLIHLAGNPEGGNPNCVGSLPRALLLSIFEFLSTSYIPTSPFGDIGYPGKPPKQEGDNNADDDYF